MTCAVSNRRPLRVWFACAVVLLIGGMTGCSTAPTEARGATDEVASAQSFEVAGRISARRGADGLAASFVWAHVADSDRIDLATPLGQIMARLYGDATRVQVERGNGQVQVFADWDALTKAVFGVTVPVEELSWWVRAVPRSGVPFGSEPDAFGRLVTLRQQGWEVVYAYRDDAALAKPYRLIMRSADAEPIDVRIVIDRWGAAAQ